MASLSISTIQPEFFLASAREPTDRLALRSINPTNSRLIEPPRPLTDHEAWEKFDSEFRPDPRSPSLIKRELQTAKFGLDTAVFAVDRFVKSIDNQTDLSFERGRLQRTHATPFARLLDNPRVKLDLEMLRDKPYAGVRLVIPFGN